MYEKQIIYKLQFHDQVMHI